MWSYAGERSHVSDNISRGRTKRDGQRNRDCRSDRVYRCHRRDKLNAVIHQDFDLVSDDKPTDACQDNAGSADRRIGCGRRLNAKEDVCLTWTRLRNSLIVPAASYEVLWLAVFKGPIPDNDIVPLLLRMLSADSESASFANSVERSRFKNEFGAHLSRPLDRLDQHR